MSDVATHLNTLPSLDQSLFERGSVTAQHRETVLHDLLGADYGFAHESGLTEMFYQDPETGYDGLLHTLTGDVMVGETGTIIPGGFHHEPSARDSLTYIDRSHLETKSGKDSRIYKETPFNEFAAQIVVEGFKKTTATKDGITGERTVRNANNGMFPNEYDALAVMQTIKQAVEHRDTSKDHQEGKTIVTEGVAPMLDGKNTMRLRLCLDQKTGKVVSAYPIVRTGRMRLSSEETKQHLGLS